LGELQFLKENAVSAAAYPKVIQRITAVYYPRLQEDRPESSGDREYGASGSSPDDSGSSSDDESSDDSESDSDSEEEYDCDDASGKKYKSKKKSKPKSKSNAKKVKKLKCKASKGKPNHPKGKDNKTYEYSCDTSNHNLLYGQDCRTM
jgi:hypothetical protein